MVSRAVHNQDYIISAETSTRTRQSESLSHSQNHPGTRAIERRNRVTSSPLSAVDRAYEFVREAVLTGQYSPGDMTSEPQIANSLGISRTPVRSALTKLQDDGWIAVYPRRGALVKGLTEREVREPIEV